MQTKAQQRQAIIRLYRQETGKQSCDMHDVAEFAIEIDQKKARGNAAKGRFGGSKQIDLDIGAVNG